MSDPEVNAYVSKVLCWHGGRLERGRLAEVSGLPEPDIGQILREEPERFPQSDRLVLARSPLRICTRYLNPKDGCPDGEERCPKLHLCRHYLRDLCPPNRRPRCRFSHNVQSDHNRAVLKTNELNGLNEGEIKVLLSQNDSAMLPEICAKYMDNECEAGEGCSRLHLCRHFLRGQCYNHTCRRSHNMLQCQSLQDCGWLSTESIQNFQMLCVLRHRERHEGEGRPDTRGAARSRGRDRGRGRGWGRGRGRGRGRDGSRDFLDSRSRERRSEGAPYYQHSQSSRASSVCSHRSRDEDFDNLDSDREDRQKTREDSLLSDWFDTGSKEKERGAFDDEVKPRPGRRPFHDASSRGGRAKSLSARTVDNTLDNPTPKSSTAKHSNDLDYTPYSTNQRPPTGHASRRPLSPSMAEPPKIPSAPNRRGASPLSTAKEDNAPHFNYLTPPTGHASSRSLSPSTLELTKHPSTPNRRSTTPLSTAKEDYAQHFTNLTTPTCHASSRPLSPSTDEPSMVSSTPSQKVSSANLHYKPHFANLTPLAKPPTEPSKVPSLPNRPNTNQDLYSSEVRVYLERNTSKVDHIPSSTATPGSNRVIPTSTNRSYYPETRDDASSDTIGSNLTVASKTSSVDSSTWWNSSLQDTSIYDSKVDSSPSNIGHNPYFSDLRSRKPLSPPPAELTKVSLTPNTSVNSSARDWSHSEGGDVASPATSKIDHILSNTATVAPNRVVPPSTGTSYHPETRGSAPSVPPTTSSAVKLTELHKVPLTPSSTLNRSVNLTRDSSTPEGNVSPNSPAASSMSENCITRSQSATTVTTQYKSGTSPFTGLCNTPSTSASTKPSYPHVERLSAAHPKPTEGHLGASSSSGNSYLQNVRPSLKTGEDPPSRKLASVKPIPKTDAASDILSSRDIDNFLKALDKPKPKATTFPPQTPPKIPHVPPRTSSIEETLTICPSRICGLGGLCPFMHYDLPYRWQVFRDPDWHDLPEMEKIEKAYSDPKNDWYLSINFQYMRDGAKPLRRLSTPSSVRFPQHALTTEWIWYWKDEFGNWIQYGEENFSSNILASDLESIYLSNPTDTIEFSAGNQSYSLSFREMKQKNMVYLTEREVQRRPKFQDLQTVQRLKESTTAARLAPSPQKTRSYPSEWNMDALPENGYRKLLVSQTSNEFSNITLMFSKTMPDHKVKRLWRVQNGDLWQQYQRQKDQMGRKNPGVEVKECRLFFGTDSRYTERICTGGFDRRFCSTDCIAYGHGTYFSSHASYSHKSSPPNSIGDGTMFLARVLVGDFVRGNTTIMRLPEKLGTGQSYDSCVDNVSDPSIYVVFRPFQSYPEYIVEYEEGEKKACIIS